MPMRKEAAVSTGAVALSVMLAQDGLVARACIGHVGHKGQLALPCGCPVKACAAVPISDHWSLPSSSVVIAGFVPVIERCRHWLLGHVRGDWRLCSAALLCAMHAIAAAMLSRPRPLLGRALVRCACRGQILRCTVLLQAWPAAAHGICMGDVLVGGGLLQACLAVAATACWGHALTGAILLRARSLLAVHGAGSTLSLLGDQVSQHPFHKLFLPWAVAILWPLLRGLLLLQTGILFP